MKLNFSFYTLFLGFIGGINPAFAQENAVPKWDVEIPGPLSDGTAPPPAEKPQLPSFSIQKSRVTRMPVTESPELAELPPPKGLVNATVQLVADPGVPDPPAPPPPSVKDAAEAAPNDSPSPISKSQIVFLSATVYDHAHTLLEIHPSGNSEKTLRAWSNIDFNHFSGFSSYRINEENGSTRDCMFVMGIGNTDSAESREIHRRSGEAYNAPAIPTLPTLVTAGPSFSVLEGEQTGEAVEILEQLHDLYRKEGTRLKTASEARKAAYETRKAFLLAHPPRPKDVSIQIWKRPKPVGATQNVEGGDEQ